MAKAKKNVGRILCAVMCVLILIGGLLYWLGIQDQNEQLVLIFLALGLVAYALEALHPIPYLEYIAFAFVLAAMGIFIVTEVNYISVCIAGIDDKFTIPYVAQIVLMVLIGFLGIFPTLFNKNANK